MSEGTTGAERIGPAGHTAEESLARAVRTMREVRERCVWSAARDHADLVPYLVEESAEVVDAVEHGTREDLREELGDLLWQVLFHAQIASEDPEAPFDLSDVADALVEKMTRRHPHVFGSRRADTPEEVLVLWNAAKAEEKRSRTTAFEGIPSSMPALARAQKMLGRAPAPVTRETASPRSEEELGEELLRLVALARAEGWDAERALRARLRTWEGQAEPGEGLPR